MARVSSVGRPQRLQEPLRGLLLRAVAAEFRGAPTTGTLPSSSHANPTPLSRESTSQVGPGREADELGQLRHQPALAAVSRILFPPDCLRTNNQGARHPQPQGIYEAGTCQRQVRDAWLNGAQSPSQAWSTSDLVRSEWIGRRRSPGPSASALPTLSALEEQGRTAGAWGPSTSPGPSRAAWGSLQARALSTEGGRGPEGGETGESNAGDVEVAEEKPRQRLRRRERYGTYEDDIETEVEEGAWEVQDEKGNPYFTHLYDARQKIDEWLDNPTFLGMLSAPPEEAEMEDRYGELAAKKFEEEEGPELRWETRLVLGPGGNAWHPANRKVKVSVYVRELGLTPLARERLVALVGRRYNPNKDELTIVSERYAEREENRKDVLRLLLAVIQEAKLADELAAQEETPNAAGATA